MARSRSPAARDEYESGSSKRRRTSPQRGYRDDRGGYERSSRDSHRDRERDVRPSRRDERREDDDRSARRRDEPSDSSRRRRHSPEPIATSKHIPSKAASPPPPSAAARAPPKAASPVPASSLAPGQKAGESEDDFKKRQKRERLEAWKADKAKKAAEKAAAAADGAKQASPTPAKKATAKPAGVSARLGLPIANKALPTPSTSKPKRANAASLMEDEDDSGKATTMFKPEAIEAPELNGAVHEEEEEDDLGDDDDDSGGMDEKARAELAREKALLKESKRNDAEVNGEAEPVEEVEKEVKKEESTDVEMEEAPVAKKKVAVKEEEVKPDPGAMEEDEELDPLDAFMSTVSEEVKKVDAEDQTKIGMKRGIKLSAMDVDGVIEDGDEETQKPSAEDDFDKIGLDAADIMALANKKLKKKDIVNVDHSKVDYEPFRKSFYNPPPEVQAMTDEDASNLRLQLDGIKIRGVDCPKPITKWSYCGLPAVCLDQIKKLNYAAPTSIQTQAIPAIMSGRDVIGVAKTGSGKTIAFLLPLFRHIKDQRPLESLEGPIAMIMTPTRELATQIFKECKPFLKALNLRASCLYGGSPLKDNIAELKRGVEIVVCTPGRMIELLTTNSGKIISMKRITYLVLDEADRMFDMGFEPQVTKIINQIRPDRQTVLFSATFPKQMEGLARKVLKKPLEITVGGRSVVAAEIEQVVEVREEETKFNRLLEILGRYSNDDPEALILIFVDRQESADALFQELMKNHYSCQSLHGGKEQVDRDQVLTDFKSGVLPIVIATSVAARGLDVKQLKLVINYDAPNHLEDYVHRAGRTGRAGNKGTCITFITPEQDKYAVDLHRAMTASGAIPPPELKAMSDSFLEKVKSGKASVAGSGFGGKGLDRFDQEREATRQAERATYGEDEVKKEEDDSEEPSAPANVPDIAVEVRRGPAPDTSRRGLTAAPTMDPAQAAKALANSKDLNPMERAKLVAASLNVSLRNKRMEHSMHDDRGEAAGADYHAIVPINDFPQKARWKVTNKETMSILTEETGASITNKGIFYDKGKEPDYDDPPKLHLLIESNDEARVKMAIQSIKRILFDATLSLAQAEQRQQGATGRYTI